MTHSVQKREVGKVTKENEQDTERRRERDRVDRGRLSFVVPCEGSWEEALLGGSDDEPTDEVPQKLEKEEWPREGVRTDLEV